jgi:hypothetical protein
LQATIPQLTRSSLHRCFERHGISRVPEVEGDKPRRKKFVSFRREDATEAPSAKCFGFVQIYDEKPRRRLWELLKSQGMQENQQVIFMSDGGEDVRRVQQYLHPFSEHLLDWFHITMRLTVLQQQTKGL